jgi:hypothetical protein
VTAPPLPASACIRVRLDYTQSDSFDAGSRFFLSYAGSAPTGANCTTLASDIQGAWTSHLAGLISEEIALTEVDVLDIATTSGLSGQWTGNQSATRTGTVLPAQCATNIEYDIARRYRGGKPRMFLPAGVAGDQQDAGHWSSTFLTAVNTNFAAFISEIEALTIGAIGTLAHVNLSYYQGFTNVTNSSGRTRAAPKYRATALVDNIVGYSAKAVIGSQKRRRAATTY